MDATLLNQGLTLMLVGMGTVFVFLTLLVAAMTLMARIVGRPTPAAGDGAGVSDEEVAAITVAIAMHRKKKS